MSGRCSNTLTSFLAKCSLSLCFLAVFALIMVYHFEHLYYSCPINYAKFPFHKAHCQLKISSAVHDKRYILFEAIEGIAPDERLLKTSRSMLPGYHVSVKYLEGNDTTGQHSDSSQHEYSVVGLDIYLTSKHGNFMFTYFIPTFLFTVTSWVSFILPPTNYPSRTSLLVTVFLCQIGMFRSAIADNPSAEDGESETLYFISVLVF